MAKMNAVKKFLMQRTAGSGTTCVRVDRELSGQNRRLYRQSRTYRVKANLVGSSNMSLDVYKLRDSFMLQKGYSLAMQQWNKSYEEAKDVVKGNVRGRWRDFRIDIRPFIGDVFANSVTLKANGTGVTATPVQVDEYANSSTAYTTGGLFRDFGLRTDSNTFDIIAEYNKEGKVQPSPQSSTTEAAYVELNANLEDDEVLNLQGDGNLPPYDADSTLPLEVLEYVGTIYRDADGNTKSTTGYFDAPLGAVYFFGGSTNVPSIIDTGGGLASFYCEIEVQAGDYKGVMAHPYVDAKKLGSGN